MAEELCRKSSWKNIKQRTIDVCKANGEEEANAAPVTSDRKRHLLPVTAIEIRVNMA